MNRARIVAEHAMGPAGIEGQRSATCGHGTNQPDLRFYSSLGMQVARYGLWCRARRVNYDMECVVCGEVVDGQYKLNT